MQCFSNQDDYHNSSEPICIDLAVESFYMADIYLQRIFPIRLQFSYLFKSTYIANNKNRKQKARARSSL